MNRLREEEKEEEDEERSVMEALKNLVQVWFVDWNFSGLQRGNARAPRIVHGALQFLTYLQQVGMRKRDRFLLAGLLRNRLRRVEQQREDRRALEVRLGRRPRQGRPSG